MAFAIELALDAESAAPVRALWRRLAEAGIRFMAESGADPHVSLVIWDGLDVERAAAEVVYLALAPSPRLAELQARVDARFAPLGRARWPHYAPEAWIPHCTLAMDFGSVTAATALAVAGSLTLPLAGRLERMAIVEFRPVRERFSRPLTSG